MADKKGVTRAKRNIKNAVNIGRSISNVIGRERYPSESRPHRSGGASAIRTVKKREDECSGQPEDKRAPAAAASAEKQTPRGGRQNTHLPG